MLKLSETRNWNGILLFLLVVAVYLPTFQSRFIWDDDDYILENTAVQAVIGLMRIWCDPQATPQYYPLVFTSFWLEHRLWGLNPTGYHVVNVILHALLTVLIWRLFVGLQIPGAWLAADIFGIHPVHVESVAWIAERKNVLSGVCYVSALSLMLPFLVRPLPIIIPSVAARRYLFATLLYAGALLSKSVTCSLPATYLLIAYWKRGAIGRRDIQRMLPWFVMGGASAMHTAWLERSHVGASGSDFSWSFIERCWIAGNAIWFYLEKLLWPINLTFFYPRWEIDVDRPLGWVGPCGALVLLAGLWWFREKIGRDCLVAALFFGGTLLPALGFINVYPMRYSFVADHFQYLASLGPIVLVASLISRLQRSVLVVFVPLLLLSLGVATWQRQASFRDLESLWTDVLAKNPNSFAAHFHLGKVRTSQSRHEEATTHFRESLRRQTDETESHIIMTLLGNSLARQGKLDEAEEYLKRALALHADDWEAIHGLATVAARRARYREAIELYRQAASLRPNNSTVRYNLGNVLALNDDLDTAVAEYETAIQLQPDFVDAVFELANAYVRQGRLDEAQTSYQKVLSLRPDHPRAKANLNRVQLAIEKRMGSPP